MPSKTKQEAYNELNQAQTAMNNALKAIEQQSTGELWEAMDLAKKRLNKAKREARAHWTPGDTPIL